MKTAQLEIKLTELQVLKGAMGILRDPKQWTTGLFAKDIDGNMCSPSSTVACCFCAVGAIRKAAGNESGVAILAMNKLCDFLGVENLPSWNDHIDRKHSEVIDAFEKTIYNLENGDSI